MQNNAPMQDQAAGRPFSQESPAPDSPSDWDGMKKASLEEQEREAPQAWIRTSYLCGGKRINASFAVTSEVACHFTEQIRAVAIKEEMV